MTVAGPPAPASRSRPASAGTTPGVVVKERLVAAQPWLSTLTRLFLGGVFLVSGWPKLSDTEGTVRSVRAFQLLPEAMVRPFAYALPVVELCVALILIVGIGTRIAGLITSALMVMFLFGIVMAWTRGLKIDCGCFGGSGGTVVDPVPGYVRDLLRDTGLLLLALGLARWPRSRFSADTVIGLSYPPDPTPAVTGR